MDAAKLLPKIRLQASNLVNIMAEVDANPNVLQLLGLYDNARHKIQDFMKSAKGQPGMLNGDLCAKLDSTFR